MSECMFVLHYHGMTQEQNVLGAVVNVQGARPQTVEAAFTART